MTTLSGPGPSRHTDPWTSEDTHDKSSHRRTVVDIVESLPEGGNAYEVWVVWNHNRMTLGSPPSQNHVNQRLGEMIDRPGRRSQYRVGGHPYLHRPGVTRVTGTGKQGLVYYAWGTGPRRRRVIPRVD